MKGKIHSTVCLLEIVCINEIVYKNFSANCCSSVHVCYEFSRPAMFSGIWNLKDISLVLCFNLMVACIQIG